MALSSSADGERPRVNGGPRLPNDKEALAWVDRQHQKLRDGLGYSFASREPKTIGPWATSVSGRISMDAAEP